MEERAIFIENLSDIAPWENRLVEDEALLKETFWDKQIVDTHGSKVVRVNDLHLLREELKLWVVHVDIGLSGLMRRLGVLKMVNFLVKLVSSCELKESLVSWKFVQPTVSASAVSSDALSLKVHHSKLAELHPADLAEILIDLGNEERIAILKSMDNVTAAHTFQELPMKTRVQVAELLGREQLLNIVNDMAVDEAVDLLSQLPKRRINSILTHLPKEKCLQISGLLGHSRSIAGSIMNTEFITVKQLMPAGEALEKIKSESGKKESIYYIYVLDDSEMLAGMVTLRELLTSPAEKPVTEFMHKRVIKVKVETKIKDAVDLFRKYDFSVIPVVDKQNKMQGIITMKDAFETVYRQAEGAGESK